MTSLTRNIRNCRSIVFSLFLITIAVSPATSAERPNVVFILSDDQAWHDYEFMGHEHIETPHLDALAKQGLLYERGYVTAPLCRPSLASLVTGQYPHQTGIRGNDPVMPGGVKWRTDVPTFAALRERMTAPLHDKPSFIRQLKQNGYLTLQTGKWWEGDPQGHGFTHAMTHGDETRGGRHGDKGLEIGRKTMRPIFDFVEEATTNEKPFFVWYGVFLPHAPHNAPKRFFDKYKDVAPNESTAWYWANVDWFDETCGQLVDHLKAKGLYENTLFVYTCDNGWVPDPNKRNRYVRSKQEPVEAGIRTPIFLTHSGSIAPRRDSTTLASNIDIATTILQACGIKPDERMEGRDLRDTEALKKRDQVFVEAYLHDSDLDKLDDIDHGLKARVIIDGWDKLTVRKDGASLFDLKADRDDRSNLAQQAPEKVNELKGRLNAWLKKTTR